MWNHGLSRILCKRTTYLWVLLFTLVSCRITDHSERDGTEVSPDLFQFPNSGYQDIDPEDLPRFEFDATTMDMGAMSQGTKVEKTYRFTNSGAADLIIADVRATCGCTVGKDWPRKPVPPGESGEIKVEFNSEGRTGVQEKTITVVANTAPSTTVLFLRGEVLSPTND